MVEINAALVTAFFGGMAVLVTAMVAGYIRLRGAQETVRVLVDGRMGAALRKIDQLHNRLDRTRKPARKASGKRRKRRVPKRAA